MAEIKKKLKARQCHRLFVEKVMEKSRGLIEGEQTADVSRKLQANKRTLEGKLALLEAIDGEVVGLMTAKDNIETEIMQSSEFTASVNECLVQIDLVLNTAEKKEYSSTEHGQTQKSPGIAKAKLPKLSLNKFSGNPVDWQAFWDSFNSAINSNPALGEVDKFNYLKSLLQGSATETINGFSLTKENYTEAIKLLQERYGNKQVVISAQMDSLLKLPEATSMNEVKKLRNIYDKLECHVRSLQNIGVSSDTYGSFLAPVVMAKIPEELRILITRELSSEEWKLEPLLKVFKQELQLRERCAFVGGTSPRRDNQSNSRYRSLRYNNQPSTSTLLAENKGSLPSREGPWCTYCNGKHPSSNCTVVTNISTRKQILRRKGKCFRCLRTGHLARDCQVGKPCYNCGQKHHTSICDPQSKPGTQHPHHSQTEPQQQIFPPTNPFLQVPQPSATNMFVHHQPNSPVNPPFHPCMLLPQSTSSLPLDQLTSVNPFVPKVKNQSQANGTSSLSLIVNSKNNVLLQTARANVSQAEAEGNSANIRLIFDSCSQRSYVTESLKKSLNLPVIGADTLLIKTFGETHAKLRTCDIVQLAVQTLESGKIYITAYVVPVICSAISNQSIDFSQERYQHLQSLPLADDTHGSRELSIHLLVGADYYWSLVTGDVVRGGHGLGPVALQTKLGYVLSGPIEGSSDARESTVNLSETHVLKVATSVIQEDLLEQDIKAFWDLESIGIKNDEPAVYEKFLDQIRFDGERYEVKLPFKENHSTLPDNYQPSRSRLESLLRRLKSKPEVLKRYDQVIQEQLEINIIEPVSDERAPDPGKIHYLPHREVLRLDKKTTKLRVVYDASSKQNGPSLNDCLYSGPSLTPLIFDILLRFRLRGIGIIADIEKAFLNVSVVPEDRDYLRFLWVDDITKTKPQIVVRRFTRVVFGVSSSPFLLNGTIHHHVNSFKNIDPEFVEEVLQSLYVDDLASSVSSVPEGFLFYEKLKKRFKEGGFNMRKWVTNSEVLRKMISSCEEQEEESCEKWQDDQTYSKTALPQTNVEEEHLKVLGITWDNELDKLIINLGDITQYLVEDVVTKRVVLSSIAKVYDPLGLLSPITTTLKILFQAICKKKNANWDAPIDDVTARLWKSALTDMEETSRIQVDRCCCPHDENDEICAVELHGFGDASEKAYGGVVYIRIVTRNSVVCKIVASKSRVSPISGETIPRLELLSGLVLARLISHVAKAISGVIKIDNIVCWLDSEIALWWITGSEKVYKPFVQNRVVEIRKLVVPKSWRHVSTHQNPADVLSRGCKASELEKNQQWWSGPEFLTKSIENWPKDSKFQNRSFEVDPSYELKRKAVPVTTALAGEEKGGLDEIIDCERYNDFDELLRVTGYILRFLDKIRRRPDDHRSDSLELDKEEILQAEALWIKQVQKQVRAEPSFKHTERALGLFEDEQGILRSRGRLHHAPLPYSTRFPAILPRNHHVTEMIIKRSHRNVMHNGLKETLTELRSKFWIVKGRQKVRKVISTCATCKRIDGKCYSAPPPPPLPQFRVSDEFAYTRLGVDFAGPVFVKNVYSNARRTYKAYIALFTCASTRGIHLELTPDLSAQAFIRCLQRFMGRRGVPSFVVSDNGKTFKNSMVKKFIQQHNIAWKFNVPLAPWWGGFFERMVRCVKRCLKKTLGNARVTFEEFETVLIQVEAILNSRPLTYVYEEMSEPLTPSNLCLGRRLLSQSEFSSRPSREYDNEDVSRRNKFLTSVLQHFWNRWRREYLTELREHHATKKTSRNSGINQGDIVCVHEDKIPRQQWKVGRVASLIHGQDGKVRAAVVRLSSGGRMKELKRPIQRLFPIEVRSTGVEEDEVCPHIKFVPDDEPEHIHELQY